MPSVYKYTTDELGFNRLLVKGSIFESPEVTGQATVGATNVFSGGSSAESFVSGDMAANVNLVDGHLQSSNFVSGSAGWQITGEGNLEANDGNFRGDITAATGLFGGTIGFENVNAGTNTNALNVGAANVKIDGANKRILINDGSYDRVLLGYQSGGF